MRVAMKIESLALVVPPGSVKWVGPLARCLGVLTALDLSGNALWVQKNYIIIV